MFSVIIPLYNKAPYVEKAIRSVLNQTLQDFELIVINDGSTDNSYEVVQKLFSSLTPPSGGRGANPSDGCRVYTQQNQGVSATRNKGVSLAKYDYIAFLDADDWWESTFLEEMKILIDDYPEAGIWGCSYNIIKGGKTRLPRNGVEPGVRGYVNYFQCYARGGEMPLWTGSVVLKKTVFEAEKGFSPVLKLGEDFHLWVRIAAHYSVVYENKPLANYNQDVDLQNRAIGLKFYKPEEHMLFVDYGILMQQSDFRQLYERLALYGLLPYYLSKINKKEVKRILDKVDWNKQEAKYLWYYKRIPRQVLKWSFELKRVGFRIKNSIR